jgi:hypothetical protein
VLEDRYDNPTGSGGLCHNKIAIKGEPKQNSHDGKPPNRITITKRFAMLAKTENQPLHDTNDKMRMTGETRCRNMKSGQSEESSQAIPNPPEFFFYLISSFNLVKMAKNLH